MARTDVDRNTLLLWPRHSTAAIGGRSYANPPVAMRAVTAVCGLLLFILLVGCEESTSPAKTTFSAMRKTTKKAQRKTTRKLPKGRAMHIEHERKFRRSDAGSQRIISYWQIFGRSENEKWSDADRRKAYVDTDLVPYLGRRDPSPTLGFKAYDEHNHLVGKIVIPARFRTVSCFQEGLAGVKLGGRWGFIDRAGTFVIEPRFLSAQGFFDGLAAVKLDDKWGFVDRGGQFAVEPRLDDARSFFDRRAAAKTGGKWGFIDRTGQWIVEPLFDDVGCYFDGRAPVSFNGKVGFINHDGEFVVPAIYEDAHGSFQNGFAAVKKHDKWGYVNRSGNEISPFIFEYAAAFSGDRAGVYIGSGNRISGFIDPQGKMVIQLRACARGRFHEGRATIIAERGDTLIDRHGNFLAPPDKIFGSYPE